MNMALTWFGLEVAYFVVRPMRRRLRSLTLVPSRYGRLLDENGNRYGWVER